MQMEESKSVNVCGLSSALIDIGLNFPSEKPYEKCLAWDVQQDDSWKFRDFQDKMDEIGISYPAIYNVRRQPIIPNNVPFPCNVHSGRYNSTFRPVNH